MKHALTKDELTLISGVLQSKLGWMMITRKDGEPSDYEKRLLDLARKVDGLRKSDPTDR